MILQVKKLKENAILPTKAHDIDAGFDLYTRYNFCMVGGTDYTVRTGIAVSIPKGYVGLVFPRSGTSFRNNIETGAGVIDPGYTGEVCVHLYMLNRPFSDAVFFNAGDRIAQLVVVPCPEFKIQEVDELESGERGDNGFGSTGR